MPYATLQNVKDYLTVNSVDATDDALIEFLLDGVTAAIDRVTGRTFAADGPTNRSFEVPWGSDELLFDHDLASLTSVLNANSGQIASSDYRLLPLNGYPKYGLRLLSNASWEQEDDGLVVVNGVWAYAPTVPDAIVHACVVWTAAEYRKRTGEGENGGMVTPDGVRILPAGMPKTVAVILNAYKRSGVA